VLQHQRRLCEFIKNEPDPNAAKEKARQIIKESLAALSEERKKALQGTRVG
jgi:hypothetical protein